MFNNERKHGIVAVGDDVVELIQTQETQKKRKSKLIKLINEALEIVFNQMRIAGNRPRSIDSYE